jgi:hypothetical protein
MLGVVARAEIVQAEFTPPGDEMTSTHPVTRMMLDLTVPMDLLMVGVSHTVVQAVTAQP